MAAGITYLAQTRLRRAIAALPLDRLLLESDAPDLPPAGVHDSLNAPEFLSLTLAALAALFELAPEKIARQTVLNTRQLFNLTAINSTLT